MTKTLMVNSPVRKVKQNNAISSFYNKQVSITYGEIDSNNKDGTCNVLLSNGFVCENIKIRSTGYPSKDPLVGGIKYPPLKAQVIILHPENDINSGFIMPAPLDFRDDDVNSEILGQGNIELIEGGWIKTFEPTKGIFTFTHKDFPDLILTVDPDSKITNIVDFNGNKILLDDAGMSIEDLNGNTFKSSSSSWDINGNADNAVKHLGLTTAMTNQDTATNAEFTKIATSITAMVTAWQALGVTIPAYVPAPVVTDISGSKVDNVKFS
jgi:hypothetical protein